MNPQSPSPITLTETFHHSTDIFQYHIRWTSLGNLTSPPLVFVHGTPWSSIIWHPFAQSLSHHFHVYLFDNPGFGQSPLGVPIPGNQPISDEVALDADLAQQSEVFAALYKHWQRDWLGTESENGSKAHVICHDHGGLMTLRANLLHGCEYRSLCLIDVVALGPSGQPLFKLVAENQAVFESLTGPVFEGGVESYIRDAAHTELDRETMDMLKRPWLDGEEGRRGFVRQMVQANFRSTAEVEGLYGEVGRATPVKVIWGAEDKWIPVETAERLKEALNAREMVVIEGAGHLVTYDQPGKLGVELGLWLGGLR